MASILDIRVKLISNSTNDVRLGILVVDLVKKTVFIADRRCVLWFKSYFFKLVMVIYIISCFTIELK